MGSGGEDLRVYAGTLALLARHRHAIPFAEMVSPDAALALETALEADNAAKVLISNMLGSSSH